VWCLRFDEKGKAKGQMVRTVRKNGARPPDAGVFINVHYEDQNVLIFLYGAMRHTKLVVIFYDAYLTTKIRFGVFRSRPLFIWKRSLRRIEKRQTEKDLQSILRLRLKNSSGEGFGHIGGGRLRGTDQGSQVSQPQWSGIIEGRKRDIDTVEAIYSRSQS